MEILLVAASSYEGRPRHRGPPEVSLPDLESDAPQATETSLFGVKKRQPKNLQSASGLDNGDLVQVM